MILTLRQFLENTDIGKEEWSLCFLQRDKIQCKNRKIIQPFWKDYSKFYNYYI